jgi:hypothetical protein
MTIRAIPPVLPGSTDTTATVTSPTPMISGRRAHAHVAGWM